MAPQLKTLIKVFDFGIDDVADLEIGPSVSVIRARSGTQLSTSINNDANDYSTGADLFVKSRVGTFRGLKAWLGFEAEVVNPTDSAGAALTSVGFRLGDGTDEYYWDGGAWAVSTTLWSPEADVADNISSFAVTPNSIQVIVNLVTTDSGYTPTVNRVKLSYQSRIEFQEDYIHRSLVPLLRNSIRPIADYPIRMTATTSTIDLNDFPLETAYEIDSIDSVYNVTTDPDRMVDIFSSYDSGTKIITLSGPINSGEVAWIQFLYEPEIAVTTDQEYSELAKVPALVLTDIELANSAETATPEAVFNKVTGAGVKVPGPLQADIDINMRIVTGSARDQGRLADEAKKFFRQNPLLRSAGLDDTFRLWLLDEYKQSTFPNQKGLHSGRLRFRVVKALFFERPAVNVSAVRNFVIQASSRIVDA